jgi:hypothetical protein
VSAFSFSCIVNISHSLQCVSIWLQRKPPTQGASFGIRNEPGTSLVLLQPASFARYSKYLFIHVSRFIDRLHFCSSTCCLSKITFGCSDIHLHLQALQAVRGQRHLSLLFCSMAAAILSPQTNLGSLLNCNGAQALLQRKLTLVLSLLLTSLKPSKHRCLSTGCKHIICRKTLSVLFSQCVIVTLLKFTKRRSMLGVRAMCLNPQPRPNWTNAQSLRVHKLDLCRLHPLNPLLLPANALSLSTI